MDDPSALRSDERAALAAWADEGDLSDGFGDRVVATFLAERLGQAEEEAPEARARAREGGVVRVIGLVAAIAAAAAVMLMVMVLPRASAGVEVADARGWDQGIDELGLVVVSEETRALEPSRGARAAAVLAQHCAPCHDSSDPEGKPQALDVFDLEQPQWWITMSDAQLEEARLRVQELGAATEEERGRVAGFVETELARRAHAG